MPIQRGKVAPAFTLTDTSGSKVSLRAFRGRSCMHWKRVAKAAHHPAKAVEAQSG